MSFNRYYSR
uniref:Uncharacterized protein n=1 Tax=Romanomermis culicivorax TaxID=13658 RepID=A0A915JYW4_ROMCU